MDQQARRERLAHDLKVLEALRRASPILDFSSEGSPPDRYTVVLHGRGFHRPLAPRAAVEVVEEHRCEIRLPYSYPERPPQVRWLTPIFHPNVSFSGFISLNDIGLPWDSQVGLDVVCERLWDVARFAFMNLDRAANHAAASWFREPSELRLPADERQLRGVVFPAEANIVRYDRRDKTRSSPPRPAASPPEKAPPSENTSSPERTARPIVAERSDEAEADVMFIGEETLPAESPPDAAPPRRQPRPNGDEDVFYIGDE